MTKWNMLSTYYSLMKLNIVILKHYLEVSDNVAYIAMTIAQDTDYILLDEPLNNLDMKHSVQIMQTLRDLCRQLNKTIIIVLHDINFASCYSDDIIALKQGELVKADDKDNVIQSDILKVYMKWKYV